jgi:hypothetical protein
LHAWFKYVATSGEINAETGEIHTLRPVPRVSKILCWGLWREHCSYAQKPYIIKGMLQDPSPGSKWTPEPYTEATVQNMGTPRMINGTFRHKECARVSTSDEPFTDLTCCLCARIPQEMAFRMRVLREDSALEKRGARNTGTGRRLGYLSVVELASHSRIISKKYRAERAFYAEQKCRVAQFKMYKPLLKELRGTDDATHDVLRFCTNIVRAHRVGDFSGRPAL